MRGKTIMYVHGFGSSAASGTVSLLARLMPQARIVAEDLPLHPAEALDLLRNMAAAERPDLIIGSSMGGMYAEMLYGYDRILVNPAFCMGDTMTKHGLTGKQTFANKRKDGVQEFIVTKALIAEYKAVTEQCFAHVADEEQGRVYGLFGDKDPLVDTFGLFRTHYHNAIHFHGEHQLTDPVALHYLVPLIRRIDDRQQQRQRPVMYIAVEAMKDSYDKPRSSMHKTYEMLLEHYNIYLMASAPTNDHAALQQAQDWCEQYLSAPAHDRIIFTNAPELSYGDYLISAHPVPDFMGTVIQIGTDEFKTWEDIDTFFRRLGGQ